jgi:hypothetical protein
LPGPQRNQTWKKARIASGFSLPIAVVAIVAISGFSAGGERACFDSLGDLNFMEELMMVVWTIRQIRCWIFGG